jgi:D-alanyl-D-alanine carboxypeptidase (penicillin-binding protein 5/6)
MVSGAPSLLSRLVIIAALLAAFALSPAALMAAPAYQEVPEPEISAQAAIVVEYPSGRILYSRAMHERMAPASLTKILTAILVLEQGNLEDVVTVAPEDLVGESSMGVVAGEQQTLHNLLYGLMLPSGNDAAMAIARSMGAKSQAKEGASPDPIERFSDMMNARVGQLGLADSQFKNPHGLDMEGHYSTAYDLASLTWYALHFPTFNEIVRQVGYDAPGHPLLNTNEMLTRYPGADGVKTGWTDGCGLCLVTSATRDGKRLVSVVLNAPHWYQDSAAILDYGFAKLAATPLDTSAEVLSVSKRGTVSWLLVNAAETPPVPLGELGQGGGAAPQGADANTETNAPAPGFANQQPGSVEQAALLVMSSKNTQDNTLWVMALFAIVGSVTCYLLATRLWRFKPLSLFGGAARVPFRPSSPVQPAQRVRTRATPISEPPPAARTLGASTSTRRREPNLLISHAEEREMHIERAVNLALEGRQGSSMSEFLLALRLGSYIDVADLAERYEMAPGTFLALSRAQVAIGAHDDARRTLVHAVLVLPDNRVLRLALNQLTNGN